MRYKKDRISTNIYKNFEHVAAEIIKRIEKENEREADACQNTDVDETRLRRAGDVQTP